MLPTLAGCLMPHIVAGLFLDTFSGTEGTLLTAHTPDIAPPGFVYRSTGFGPNTVLQLDGAGRATTVPVGYGTGGGADSQNAPAFLVEPTFPYTVELIGKPTTTLGLSLTRFLLETSDSSKVEITINQGPVPYTPTPMYPNPWWVNVEVENTASGGYYFFYHPITNTEHTVTLRVSASSVALKVDGVDVTPQVVFAGAMMNDFNYVDVWVDGDSPVPNAYIDRVEVRQEE